ncbi:hypothetical protein SETIT_9G140700v2 [Setaria italica]|uniref:Uncharacterized protein n=2 Tax=Setaria TaxID=4554 RepID=K4AGN4_SETIT|nr:hypothetical protein SETIT_9G140700v2 [Setaria italica]TKV92069.1 hypothetical protein SEVIR_9G139100v2 [Setaria viridis]
MGEPRGRSRKSRGAAMRALRGARDLYVRGLRGLDRLLAAASPRRAGVGRPTSSRVFGVGCDRDPEEELRELVRAMQARRAAAPSSMGAADASGKEAAGAPVVKKRRGATQLERINEDAAVVYPTS